MDPVAIGQLLSQLVEMQKRLAEGLQATNQNLAAIVANGDRRQETILKENRDGRARHWDDGEKFRNCKVYAGRSADWEEWNERLMGTIKTRASKIHSLMKLVELNGSEKVFEGSNYAVDADVGMESADEVLEASAKLHHLLAT